MKSYLFLVGGIPELDQFLPIIEALGKRGQQVELLINEAVIDKNDPLVRILQEAQGLSIHRTHFPSGRFGEFSWNRLRVRRLLAGLSVGLIAVEWGTGYSGDVTLRNLLRYVKNFFFSNPATQLKITEIGRAHV